MFKLLELFGGIGACSKALDNLGIDYEIVDYVEIDKYAVASYNAIHNTNFVPQDICEWDKDIEVDLIMHGSPCQDFSLAGKQAGGDEDSGTRSSLMYETLRIIEKLKPKYVIWENVKNLLSYKHRHNFIKYVNRMESLGYKNYHQVLNATDYGIPQQRERVFTVSIRNDIEKDFSFPPKTELKLKLKDMLEKDVDEKYYLSDKMIRYISATGTKDFYYKPEIDLEIARPLSTDQNKRAGTTNYVSEDFVKNGVPKVIGGIGEKLSNNGTQWYQQNRIYDDNIALSIATQFNPYYSFENKSLKETLEKNETPNDYGFIDGYNRNIRDDELSGTITTRVSSSNQTFLYEKEIPIKTNNKTGYIMAHDGDGIYTNVSTKRGTVQTQLIPTLTSFQDKGVVLEEQEKLRIRKLTPKECWRLMGFSDEDFEKASQVNSNAQLYKQAGNSIVVNVLMAILTNLLLVDVKEDKQLTLW